MTERDALPEEDEHVLVFRAKNGDNAAFDKLMLLHQAVVGCCMRRYSASLQVVEELTQTVFIKAFMNLSLYHPIAPFGNWLKTIAYRVGLDFWRAESKKGNISYHADMDVYAEKTADAGAGHETFDRLARVVNQLPPEDRQVLYMLHVDEISIADIAKIMGWNPSMTKMRAFRARRKLRKILEEKQ